MCVDDEEVDTQNNDDEQCDDDIYGLSSEDEDLSVETERGSGKKDANSGLTQQDDLLQDFDDELSNYEFENEIENFSSSDLDLEDNEYNVKEMAKQKIRAKVFNQSAYGIEFQYEADGKIKLKECLLLANIHKLMEVLRDYTIQEDFKFVRVKNERTRITFDSRWIAKKLESHLRANLEMSLDAMQSELQERFGIEARRM
ncbi:hypothetical protein F0562_011868 [Nyssa sinensis]|uniref:Uncharacterized protein n=1 Tax=Nyssa sinensis TaxID=561372 RepID=A0A5J4ZVN4_9ASTE|nr:hypothetical protein F0562_011868 [Nyssa sinensis]